MRGLGATVEGGDERREPNGDWRSDPAAFAALVEGWTARLLRAAVLICRDRALAEDVVQEAWLRAWRHRASFHDGSPFAPWIYRILIREAERLLGRPERRHALSYDPGDLSRLREKALPPDPSGTPEAVVLRSEQAQRVWRALATLPPADRAALILRYDLGLNAREVADALGCAPGTIRWRLHRARRLLEAALRAERAPTRAGAGEEVNGRA